MAVGAALLLTLLLPSTALAARHVYVSNLLSPGTANISGFTLASNGALAPNGAPGGSGTLGVSGLVATPDGAHLYGANGDMPGTIGVLAVAADGTLSTQGSPVAAGGNQPIFMAIAPDGKHLYVQLNSSNTLSVLAVGTDGSLTPQASGILAGTAPTGLAVSPNGKNLYVADFNGGAAGSVLRFSIGADGGLTPVGSPTPTGGMAAFQITITPDGRYLYVTNDNSKDVSGFAIDAAGALTPVPGSPFPTGSSDFAEAITTTPDGSHLYVANTEHSISGWNINPANGALSAVGGSPLTVSPDTYHAALAASPDGAQLLAGLSTSSNLNSYAIAADGSISQSASVSSGGLNPDFQSVVPRPNQPPSAAFTTKLLKSGRVHFNANTSKDADGKVSTFRWDFGDGTPPTDLAKAGADHTYGLAGKYTATLTVIDNEGCSTKLVFTGQSALCNGSGVAAAKKGFNASVQFGLTARKLQRRRLVRATGLCPTEACNVQVGGSVTVGGKKLKLRRTRRSLVGGVARTWRIVLPRRARKALTALPRSKKLSVRITAAARAASGQGKNTSRQLTVKVRGRHRGH
jgi:6-phosphogluconolactonase (cycloisomerase 2 family)